MDVISLANARLFQYLNNLKCLKSFSRVEIELRAAMTQKTIRCKYIKRWT